MRPTTVRASFVAAAAALVVVAASPSAWAVAGQIDTTFGSGGFALTPNTLNLAGGGVVVDSTGGVLVEGQLAVTNGVTTTTDITVSRFLPDGKPDTCFGSPGCTGNGTVIAATDAQTYSGAAIAVQTDGKILAAGGIKENFAGITSFGIGVVRLNANGSIDTAFGTNGVAALNPCGSTGQASAASVKQAADGSIVLIGSSECQFDTVDQATIAKFTSTGAPASFGTGGAVVAGAITVGYDGVVDSSGRITAVGYAEAASCGQATCFWAERVNANGTLDPTFGTGGAENFAINGSQLNNGYNAALVSGGKLVVSGSCNLTTTSASNWNLCAVRLSSSGALDPTFGNIAGGALFVSNGVGSQTMAVQGNGSLVFGSVGATVVRADANGHVDTTFGSSGIGHYSAPGYSSTAANGIAVDDSRNRIYAAGAAANNATQGPYVAFAAAISQT